MWQLTAVTLHYMLEYSGVFLFCFLFCLMAISPLKWACFPQG